MSEATLAFCPECKSPHHYRVPPRTHTDMVAYHKPIEMQSIALCNNEDIRAFKRRNPGIEVSEDYNNPLHGVPIARTRRDKLSILRAENWEEKN